MICQRAKAAGIQTKIGNHTFRETGITAYLKNGGQLEITQQIAAHASSSTVDSTTGATTTLTRTRWKGSEFK
jgi:integrase